MKQHLGETLADQLADAAELWHDRLSSFELDAVGRVREALLRIAEDDFDRQVDAIKQARATN